MNFLGDKMAHHKLTIQPGDTLEVTVDDLILEEEEVEEDDDDVLGDDEDDDDDDDEDEEDPEAVLRNIPQELLDREVERRKNEEDNS